MTFQYQPLPDMGPELEFRAKMRGHHLVSQRDHDFCARIGNLYLNFEASLRGVGFEKRALLIVAPAGSGKTTLVDYHLDHMPYFQPFADEYGDLVPPILRMALPPGATSKSAMLSMLRRMGIHEKYPHASEAEFAEKVLGHMRALGIRYLFLDELQRCIRGTQQGFIKRMQDVLVALINSKEWPLHAIFVGTQEVLPLLRDAQLNRRTDLMRLAPLQAKHFPFVNKMITEIVEEACGMTYSFADSEKVPQRLVYAAQRMMGTAILFLQETCLDAFRAGRKEITLRDLQETYRTKTGCLKKDNIFLAKNFTSINPKNSLADVLLCKPEIEDNDD